MYEYKEACRRESFGQFDIGVKIFVAVNHELSAIAEEAIDRCGDHIHATLLSQLQFCSEEGNKTRTENKKNMLALFSEPIYVEEIPNQYDGYINQPWFIVTTKVGRIKIGWRKRVLIGEIHL